MDTDGPQAESGGKPSDDVHISRRLQILSTEHSSLLASRSLAWNESFTRVGMFLSTLSGALVALALVAQASDFGEGFLLFALVILPVVLFVGVTTLLRLNVAEHHDGQCVVGMNRIRAAYLEAMPELAPYFVMSAHDDARGVAVTMGLPGVAIAVHVLSATPTLVIVLNGVIAGVIAALAGVQLEASSWLVFVLAVAGFAVTAVAQLAFIAGFIAKVKRGLEPMFPSPTEYNAR